MKKLKSAHYTSKKRTSDIIRAALECFTELGYSNTSMTDICNKADSSIGSVYHHFKSKEQLSAAVYLEGIEVYQSGIIEILQTESDVRKGITSIVDYHLKWVRNNSEWAQFLFEKRDPSLFMETENKLLILNKKFIQEISGWFKQHIESGSIRPVSWDIIVSLLLGPCQEYTKLYLAKKTVSKIDDAVREISTAVWRSLSNKI